MLVTGGAGYIGSAFVERCAAEGERVVVLDDLRTGHRAAVPEGVPFVEADVADVTAVCAAVRDHAVDACVHFAGYLDVAESVADPLKYHQNNVAATLALLGALSSMGVRRFVFSSSASVYGSAREVPISEDAPCAPENPYGRTKRVIEEVLTDLEHVGALRAFSLRYFNAAGATRLSVERHDPETHLIPLALQAALGRRDALVIHGDDYPTRDGTALRDYVHVADLADAHLRALRALREGQPGGALNLGTATGTTVREVLRAVEAVTGRTVPVRVGPRRAGDVAALVADPRRAAARLGWRPEVTSIRDVVSSAWRAMPPAAG
ncbi:MAG: UDP-glucose 4-epimerase GalE [Polyangiales bacterium]